MSNTAIADTIVGESEVQITTRTGTFSAMSVPYYPRLWVTGLLWNLTRWMAIFLCSYLVNRLTHSPFYVQLVGASFFAPMFFGGATAGVISDRLDRRRTILIVLTVLTPLSAGHGGVGFSGDDVSRGGFPFLLTLWVP